MLEPPPLEEAGMRRCLEADQYLARIHNLPRKDGPSSCGEDLAEEEENVTRPLLATHRCSSDIGIERVQLLHVPAIEVCSMRHNLCGRGMKEWLRRASVVIGKHHGCSTIVE